VVADRKWATAGSLPVRGRGLLEEPADRCARLDSFDPSTFRHAGQCEHPDTSDPALLRAILKVRDSVGWDYGWVERDTCECGPQVPHYAVAQMGVLQLLDADGAASSETVSTKLGAALYARPHGRTCDGETTQAKCGPKAACAIG
jgi:hypothetical protein